MAALIRCVFPKPRNLGLSFISALSSSNNYRIALPVLAKFATYIDPANGGKLQLMKEVHRKIDFNQGISSDLFKTLFNTVETDGSVTEYDISLLLHICSIGPFNVPSQKRLELIDKIWSKLDEFGVQPTTKLYNIRLKALCANKKSFNPLEELTKMRSLGLNPDKTTYGFLIEGFCQNGDIAGANLVLESMQTAEYPLSVGIFNSMITGHLKAGSLEEATNVLEVLRSRNLSPNSNTYLRFAIHFAEQGDMDNVLKYIADAENEGIPLDNPMLLEVYRALVISGHSNKAGQLLQIISEKSIFRSPFQQMACHLASEGFNESALQVFLIMPKGEEEKTTFTPGGFLLRTMITNGQSADDVMQIIDKIVEFYPKATLHKHALFYAYKADRTDLAIQLLEKMADKNEQIKVSHLIPAICDYRNKGNKKGVYKATRMLLELEGSEVQEDRMEQLVMCSYPALKHLQQTREDIVSNFKEHEKIWNLVFFIHDIQNEGCSTAMKNVEGKQTDNGKAVLSVLKSTMIKNLQKDWKSCLDVLEHIGKQPGGLKAGMQMNGDILSLFLMNKDWSKVADFLDGMKERKLFLFKEFKRHRSLASAPDDVTEKLNALTENPIQQKSATKSFEDFDSMSKEDIKEYQKQNPNRFMPSIALLQRAMKTGDLEEMRQRLRELQARNFKLTLGMLNQAIIKLTQLGDVQLAKQYFEERQARDITKDVMPLNIAARQVKNGDIEDALEMIKCASKSTFPKDTKDRFPRLRALKMIVQDAPTLEDTSRLHSEIFASGNIVDKNDAVVVHNWYINKFLEQEDDNELLRRLTELHEKFQVFPSMNEVLTRFIEKQDVERLKKVIDLGVSVFGSTLFYHKLAMNFIRCGMPARAAAVLQSPGIKIIPRHIISGCQYFIKIKRTDCLEAVAEMTKDMPVSRSIILSKLIEGYVAVDDLAKATDVLQQYSVDLIKPEKSTIDMLLHAHGRRNLEIPPALQEFVSEVTEAKKESSSDSSSSEFDSESSSSDKDALNAQTSPNPSRPNSSDEGQNTVTTESAQSNVETSTTGKDQ